LPLVQCEEGEPPASQSNAPPRLAAEGRSFRNTDLFHDTLTLRIADLRAELAHLETIQRDGGLLADANGDPLALLVNPEPLSAKRLNNGYGETVATEHYAAFPSELPRIFIRAATSEAGCCRACGSPYVREVERTAMVIRRTDWGEKAGNRTAASGTMLEPATAKTTGWSPSCQCKAGPPRPCLVLDPFLGSGTTLLVAQELGRDGVGLELSADYVELARRRIVGASPLLADVTVEGVEA
jgi:hypothetical protein